MRWRCHSYLVLNLSWLKEGRFFWTPNSDCYHSSGGYATSFAFEFRFISSLFPYRFKWWFRRRRWISSFTFQEWWFTTSTSTTVWQFELHRSTRIPRGFLSSNCLSLFWVRSDRSICVLDMVFVTTSLFQTDKVTKEFGEMSDLDFGVVWNPNVQGVKRGRDDGDDLSLDEEGED